MASDKRMHKRLATMPGVQAAVKANGDAVEARAKANFAAHDRPGGHRIGSRKRGVDRLIYLTGPAPLSLEYGHYAGSADSEGPRTWVPAMRIMGKAARG